MKLQYILEILIICWLLCYRMFTDGDMHMSFDFGEEIPIIKVIFVKFNGTFLN